MTESANLPAKRVLIVEDSPTQAMTLTYLLEGAGLQVEHYATGQAALERLNEALPHLVITDFHLPGMTGDELCRRIRANSQGRELPILMLTSEAGTGAELHGLQSGADDYVSKDVEGGLLMLRVQALLRRSVHRGAEGQDAGLGKSRILIVEDSPTFLKLIVGTLEWQGYIVTAAASAAEALAAIREAEFEGVVSDLVLPDMPGIELCRKIAADFATRADTAPALIVLSGQETQDSVVAAFEAGVDEVVGKSRDLEILLARLRAVLRRRAISAERRRAMTLTLEREKELARVHAAKDAAEVRAALAGQLEQANRELRETQGQLVQSAKMASLGQLVAGIAHEINNPTGFVIAHLQTVQRLCEDIAREVESQLSEDAAKKLAKLRQRHKDMAEGLERVRALVLKLRTFSRLDEGEFKPASVRENVEAVLTMLQHKSKGRIEIDCRFGEPDLIACFPGLLNQALMNLVSNAIDAIEGPGNIEITTGAADAGYEITVKDSGHGIPAALRERIFEPFFTTKPVGQGTGLGMSITYQIVQKHGGTMEVESEEGKGTRIAIRLPAAVRQNAQPAGAVAEEIQEVK